MPRPTAPQTTEVPESLATGPAGDMYRWLAENGITEWLPERATIMINPAVQAITYPSYTWQGDERGFNAEYLAGDGDDTGMPIEPRIVKLVVPLTAEARASAELVRAAGLGEMKFIEL